MRILLKLLFWAWIIWLAYRILSSPRRYDRPPDPGRKKVDSTVIDKKDDNGSSDKDQDK